MLEVTLEFSIVLANDPLSWIIVTISNIVGSLGYALWSIDVVANQSLSIWSETFEDLSVVPPILYGAVVPLFIFELQVIVEEVLALNELAAVPLGDIFTLWEL